MVTRLEVVKIKKKAYFWDKRLSEFRNVKNPFDFIRYSNDKELIGILGHD